MTDPQHLDDIKAREERIAENPKAIYLAPECETGGDEGRMWCEDNVWECECGAESKHEAVKYIRADVAAQSLLGTQSALRTARADAMEEAAKFVDTCPTIETWQAELAAKAIRQLAQTGGEG